MTVMFFGATAWLTHRFVAWARDIPNRVEIEIDGDMVGRAVTESIRYGLHADDVDTQLETVRYLADAMAQNPATAAWVRDEYTNDLTALIDSPDTDVAAEVVALFAELDQSNASQPPE